MFLRTFFPLFALVWSFAGGGQPVSAQGLIWKLPEPGTWVKYQGNYTQVENRPQDATNQDLVLDPPWQRELTIKALERSQQPGENGEPVEVQWLEFVVETRSGQDGAIGGPGSRRIYKILVSVDEIQSRVGPPEEGSVVDDFEIPVSFLPILKGYRKFDDQTVTAISSPVFNVFPSVTLLNTYRKLEEIGEEDPDVQLPGINTATHYRGSITSSFRQVLEETEQKAVEAGKKQADELLDLDNLSLVLENKGVRTLHTADMWYTPDAPFGLVRWNVNAERQTKPAFASRDQFETASTYRVEMKAIETGQNATSLLTEN